MDIGGYTATGPRDANEDSFFQSSLACSGSFSNGIEALAVVSDGMGGYQGGDIASAMACAEAERYASELVKMATNNQVHLDACVALEEMARNAHEAIVAESSNRNRSMGATYVGALVSPGHAWIGHVGDSRAYLVRNGHARQLTEDHSQVGRMLSRGLITEEEAQNHPDRNRIEQALGFSVTNVDIDEVDFQRGDALLLCSDGVYTVLDCGTLASCISGALTANDAARAVVETALSKETDDNSTAVVIFPDREQSSSRKLDTLPGVNSSTMVPATRNMRIGGHGNGGRHTRGRRPSAHDRRTDSHPGNAAERRRSGPARSYVIPAAAAVLLLGAGIGLFVYAGGRGPATGGEASVQASPTPQSSVAESGESSTSAVSAPGGATASSAPTSQEGASGQASLVSPSKEYAVGNDGILRFVNAQGEAERFEYGVELELVSGTRVVPQGSPSDFKNENYVYQAIDAGYLRDVKDDIALFKQGASSFESSFSKLFGASQYLSFVQSAAEDPSFDSKVTKLILVDHLKSDQEAVTGGATSEVPSYSESNEPGAYSYEGVANASYESQGDSFAPSGSQPSYATEIKTPSSAPAGREESVVVNGAYTEGGAYE